MNLRPPSTPSVTKTRTVKQQQQPHLKAKSKVSRQQQQKPKPFTFGDNGCCSSSIRSSTSTSSIDAPKGCLRFLLSHSSSSSSSSSRTPSTFNSNASLSKPTKAKTFPYKRASSTKPNSHKSRYHRKAPISKHKTDPLIAPPSGSGHACEGIKSTPSSKRPPGSASDSFLSGETDTLSENPRLYGKTKLETESDDGSNTRATTPPIQASVSPEIQFESSISAATETTAATAAPACYGAGHLLLGLADKRKCRPRGLLIFEEAPPLANFSFDDADDGTKQHSTIGIEEDSGASVLPSPIRASMHWLLSPCHEEGDDFLANSPDGGTCPPRQEDGTIHDSPASPSSDHSHACLSSNWYDIPSATVSASSCSAKREGWRQAPTSPYEFTQHKALLEPALFSDLPVSPSEDKKSIPILNREKSPSSIGSLGSGNVMQTPLSDSGSDRLSDMPGLGGSGNVQEHNFDDELDTMVEHLQKATLSQNSPVFLPDQAASSFQFDCIAATPCSLDHSQFQKVLDNKASWFSDSSIDTAPQSHVRISWREGLASRMFEMEEFDCCRCFSEDEEHFKDLDNVCLESHSAPKLNANYASDQFSDAVPVTSADRESGKRGTTGERISSDEPYCCAESISTDGSGLTRSDDSDWALCYKNYLFLE